MSQFISLQDAVTMTTNYRNIREQILKSRYQYQNILCICETFDRSAFDRLLSHPDCASIRIYYGMNQELEVHAIIVAADAAGNDILDPTDTNLDEEDEYPIVESGVRCPEICPPVSDLNS